MKFKHGGFQINRLRLVVDPQLPVAAIRGRPVENQQRRSGPDDRDAMNLVGSDGDGLFERFRIRTRNAHDMPARFDRELQRLLLRGGVRCPSIVSAAPERSASGQLKISSAFGRRCGTTGCFALASVTVASYFSDDRWATI